MPTTRARQSEEQRLAKAMSHPDRAEALRILNERKASTSEIAEELGLDVRNLGYHIRKLRELECIEQVGTKQVRGALETFYRATVRPLVTDDEWDSVPADRRPGLVNEFFQAIVKEGARALEAGVLGEDSDFWIGPLPLKTDRKGFLELLELHDKLNRRAQMIEADYVKRAAKGEAGEEIEVISAHACFRGAPS